MRSAPFSAPTMVTLEGFRLEKLVQLNLAVAPSASSRVWLPPLSRGASCAWVKSASAMILRVVLPVPPSTYSPETTSPALKTKVSLPAPPLKLSAPAPPFKTSLPSPPVT